MSALALATMFVVLPFARRWSEREAAIEATRDRLARTQALVAGEPSMRRALESRQRAAAGRGARLVTGATPALAASALQTMIGQYADRSGVTLDRVDVVGDAAADSTAGATSAIASIPIQLTVHGDIHGVVDLLYELQHGETLLVTDEITVTAGSTQPNGLQLLMLTLRLRAPYVRASTPS